MKDDVIAAAEEILEPIAESFRTIIENRLAKLEGGPAPAIAGDSVDGDGNSLAGRVRVLESRMAQLEAVQADNTSNILRLSELVQTQLGGAVSRIAALEVASRPAVVG
jgi:hypothetical protein